jgi:hypothetical protein
MKQALLLLLLLSILPSLHAQDRVYRKDGSVLCVYVKEINPETVVYRLSGDTAGEECRMKRGEIFMIRFRDGAEDIFGTHTSIRKEKYFSNSKNEYTGVSFGVGQSYGFPGVRVQQRFGRLQGFGYHAGIGFSPFGVHEETPSVWYSAGVKFFWYKGWFLDFQFGSVPASREMEYSDSLYHYKTSSETRIALGASFLLGGDFLFNRWFGMNGAIGFSTNMTRPGYNPVSFMAEFGLIWVLPSGKKK